MIKQVRIDSIKYDIEETDDPIIINDKQCAAGIYYMQSNIKISNEMSEEQKKQSLMHEIIHGIVYERGICEYVVGDNEEKIVDQIATGVMKLIKENKELVDYLVGEKSIEQNIRINTDGVKIDGGIIKEKLTRREF